MKRPSGPVADLCEATKAAMPTPIIASIAKNTSAFPNVGLVSEELGSLEVSVLEGSVSITYSFSGRRVSTWSFGRGRTLFRA